MRTILFVDDELKLLQGLRRTLRPMRNEWSMHFASSGPEALELLAQSSFDVLVTDMQMPGMDGIQLLERARERHPEMVRIVLSGQCDRQAVYRSVRSTHQCLSKPCNPKTLKAVVSRACALRDQLADDSLKRLVSRVEFIPSLPSLYKEFVWEIRSPGVSLKKLGEVISKDVGMTAKICQLVNSAFFGIPRPVTTPVQAIALLGLEAIQALVLTLGVFQQFERTKVCGLSIDALSKHSLAVGMAAKEIAKTRSREQDPTRDAAFLAGLLHDIGKVLLAAHLPEVYGKTMAFAQDKQVLVWKAEQDTLGATHAEVGAYLAGLWGQETAVVEAIAFHHRPSGCTDQTFSPLTAVHVANALQNEKNSKNQGGDASIDLEYLESLDAIEQLPHWRQICRSNGQGKSRG